MTSHSICQEKDCYQRILQGEKYCPVHNVIEDIKGNVTHYSMDDLLSDLSVECIDTFAGNPVLLYDKAESYIKRYVSQNTEIPNNLSIDDTVVIEADRINKLGKVVEITNNLFAVKFIYLKSNSIVWFDKKISYEIIKKADS